MCPSRTEKNPIGDQNFERNPQCAPFKDSPRHGGENEWQHAVRQVEKRACTNFHQNRGKSTRSQKFGRSKKNASISTKIGVRAYYGPGDNLAQAVF